jgi:hypothetical protein
MNEDPSSNAPTANLLNLNVGVPDRISPSDHRGSKRESLARVITDHALHAATRTADIASSQKYA